MALAAAALVDLAQQPADEGAMPDTPEADSKKMITVWYASKPPARDKAWRGTVTNQTEEEFTVRFDDLASDDEQKEMPVHISLDEWAWGHHTKKATVKAADRRVSPKGKAPASGTPTGPPAFKRQAFGAPGAAVSFGLASLDADVLALTVSFVDTSLDDLAALRASFRLLRTCKTINLAIGDATHFWQPLASALGPKLPLLAESVADWASPAAAASSSAVAAPQGSLLDAMMRGLNGVCVHCRQRRCADHPDFGVPLCALCDRKKEKTRYVYDAQGLRCAVKAGGGIMAASNAKGYHRLTDGDLKKLPHKEATWYGKASKIYCKAQVVLAQDKRYGNKAAFDAVDKSRKAYNPGSYYGPDYERYGHGYGYGYW